MEATITIIEANRAHCAQQSLPVEFFNTVIIIPTFNRATSLARDHLSRASEVIPIRKRYIPTYKCGGARGTRSYNKIPLLYSPTTGIYVGKRSRSYRKRRLRQQ